MRQDIQLLNIISKLLLLALLCIIVWQQYVTFKKYESNFENPIQFIKQNYGNDYISQYANRYVEIKKMFASPVRLSYIGEENEDFATGATQYFLTQYFLAPNLVLKKNLIQDTILFNLYNSKKIDLASNYYINNGWHIVKDFNNGLIILAK